MTVAAKEVAAGSADSILWSKQMALPFTDNELWRMAAREGLSSLIYLIDQAESKGTLSKPENFAVLLNLGFNRMNMQARTLAEEEDIAKSSISRWMSGEATPPAPTRKHVINWLRQKAHAKLLELS